MSRQPWKDVPKLWKDEKAFLQWLRGAARRLWSRHPLKIEYKKQRRYKAPVGRNGKEVWVSDCEMCEAKECRKTEIDHIEQAGSTLTIEQWKEWMVRLLLVDFDDIQELCLECHGVVNLSQKLGCSIEEARVHKQIIEICKEKKDKEYLKKCGVEPEKNAKLRRKQLEKLLLGDKHESETLQR